MYIYICVHVDPDALRPLLHIYIYIDTTIEFAYPRSLQIKPYVARLAGTLSPPSVQLGFSFVETERRGEEVAMGPYPRGGLRRLVN